MQIHKSSYTVKHMGTIVVSYVCSIPTLDLIYVTFICWGLTYSPQTFCLFLSPSHFLSIQGASCTFFGSTIFAIKTWPFMLTWSWRTNGILFRWEVINNGPHYELILKNCSNIVENQYRSLKVEVYTVLFILTTKIMAYLYVLKIKLGSKYN